jgi:hypothetical protein
MNLGTFPCILSFWMFTPHRTDTSHKKGDGFLHRPRMFKVGNLFSRDVRSRVKASGFDDYFDGGLPINGLNMYTLDARYL